MTDFNEAADNFRTAQLLKLTKELQQEKAMHCATHALAVDRSERIIELARVGNALMDERDKLLADSNRLAYLLKHQAVVEKSKNGERFWLVFPDGSTHSEIFDTAIGAIDGMINREAPWTSAN